MYVDDVVSAMILTAQHSAAIGQRYLVNGPIPVTWREFYEGLAGGIGAKGPQYRSSESLRRAAQGRAGKLGKLPSLARDPERVLRKLARIGPSWKFVKAGLCALPEHLRESVQNHLLGSDTRRPGYVHMPDAGQIGFLKNRIPISSAKAEWELGYSSQFTFSRGLVPTVQYLNGLWHPARERGRATELTK